jgi:hypothetical protein
MLVIRGPTGLSGLSGYTLSSAPKRVSSGAAHCTTDGPTVPAGCVASVRPAASFARIELRLDESRYDAGRWRR